MGYTEEFSVRPTSLVVHRRVWCRVCGYAGILRGRLLGVEDTVKGSWCEYAYDASGRLIRAVSSDDVSVVWVYDPVGLLMREETHQEGALVRVRAFPMRGSGYRRYACMRRWRMVVLPLHLLRVWWRI